MSDRKLLTSRSVPPPAREALAQFGQVTTFTGEPGELAGVEVFLATVIDPVPADLIGQFGDELGLIANIGVGTDNIDLETAAARGIRVSNTPVVTEDTADLTFALLLATCRRLSVCERHLRAGDWAAGAKTLGQRVHGKTLGIVGFGAIGQALARRAAGFDMRILYHGPNPKPEAEAAVGAEYRADLGQLLEEADIVSLTCPLTPATRHIIDSTELARMKEGAVLINTGRGPLLREEALIESLSSGHLGAAGLDVFEFEPEFSPRLLEFDNVTLLPHIGSASGECRREMFMRALGNIKSFLETGEPLDNCI
jgi:glyoxylate reductase